MGRRSDEQAAQDRESLSGAIERVAEGDPSALADVYGKTSAKLFGICLRILHDRGEAEEAVQEIYVSIWRRAGTFDRSRASPISWLTMIARNRAIDRLRAGGRRRATAPIEEALDIREPGPDALTQLEKGEERSRLADCIDELEGRQSEVIRRAFFDGLTYVDLSAQSETPLGTVKSWVRRGLIKLKECLER